MLNGEHGVIEAITVAVQDLASVRILCRNLDAPLCVEGIQVRCVGGPNAESQTKGSSHNSAMQELHGADSVSGVSQVDTGAR